MLRKMPIILGFIALGFSPITNAKSLTQFYGSQKYNGLYDFNDMKRSIKIESRHESHSGYEYDALATTGRHVNIEVTKSDTGESVVSDYQRRFQYISAYARKSDGFGQESLGACQYFHDLMIVPENDEEQNLKMFIQNVPKWRIFREPYQLRKTRKKIYFNERAVRILNRRIDRESDEARYEILVQVREHFQAKVDALYEMHDELMAQNLEWRPRKWIWTSFTTNNVLCFAGESMNPEEFYEVKKEIQRIQDLIEAILADETTTDLEKQELIKALLKSKRPRVNQE